MANIILYMNGSNLFLEKNVLGNMPVK